MPGRMTATLRLSRLRAATVVRYALAMEERVSPCFPLWGTTSACRCSICADLVAGGLTVAVSVGFDPAAGCFDLVREGSREDATSASCALGEIGRCNARTRRPRRLSP